MTHPEQIRYTRRFVVRRPGQPDIHGIEFPSGRALADVPDVCLTAFVTANAITDEYDDATIHWADEEQQ